MLEMFLTRLAMSMLGLLFLAIGSFVLLRFFDGVLGIDFKEAFDKIEEDPKAMAHYFGMRNLGASIAIGFVIVAALIL